MAKTSSEKSGSDRLFSSGTAAKKQGYATFEPTDDQDKHVKAALSGESYGTASWFSRLVFGYAKPMLEMGNERQLEMDDLWELEGDIRTSVAYAKFKRAYDRHDPSLAKAMISAFGKQFLLCGLGSVITATCAVFAPVVLHQVIDAFAAPEIDLQNLSLWVGAFFASRLVNAFTEAHVNFNMEMALLQLTVSVKSLLFEKAMRRSIQSKNDNDMVDVSNLFTADMENVLWAGSMVNVVWVAPLQVVVVVYMLYTMLDVAAFAGLAVIFLFTGFNYLGSKGYMGAYNDIMKFKDSRMKVVKEVFGAIQVIKLNAWETQIQNRIRGWREKETNAISSYLYWIALMSFLFYASPLCVCVASFSSYTVLLGKELTAAKVFTSMFLFTAIRIPLNQFPDALQSMQQASAAISRMSKYLGADEVTPDRISRDATTHEDDVMIAMENASFKWTYSGIDETQGELVKPVIEDVSFQIRKGDFVVIHGEVGAGKSSLCSAILGELPKQQGNVFVRSPRVAYYSQQPWIQNMSIRDNILFGLPYDKFKYDRVVDACGLVKDIAMFPAGDKTEIGQKGVNLSGGQKARVSLARACYVDADIYILDTPLAAVDAVVQAEIFNKCLCGLLEKKTVVLVTHLHDVIASPAVNVNLLVEKNGVRAKYTQTTKSRSAYIKLDAGTEEADANELVGVIDGDNPGMSGTLINEEGRKAGRVSGRVFFAYVNALGGIKSLLGFLFILICWQSFQSGSDVWLSIWTGSKTGMDGTRTSNESMAIYALLTLGAGIFAIIRGILTAYSGTRASRYLFDEMTKSLLNAPLRFFDVNPIGRIINRYAQDVSTVDFHLPFSFYGLLATSTMNVFRLLMAIYVIRWAGLLLLPLGWVYVSVGLYYLAPSREVSRLSKVSTSPILSHLSASEEGVVVLRAFGQPFVERAILENFKRCDTANRVLYAQNVVNEWFAVRVHMIGFGVVVLIVSSLVVLREYLSPGMVGLAFIYAVSIDSGLSAWVNSWSRLEVSMVSPERIVEYIGIPAEGHPTDRILVTSGSSNEEWPQRGTLTFDNVKFAYKPGGDLVLKGLSFEIKHNEKIGIVGRTGAGKSSLTMAIFRINELVSGRITLDGVDISTVNLQTLRSRMSIIPQVPVLFKGPLRAYMDPFEEYDDASIWLAFEKIGMKTTISALDGKLQHELSENGENFSVGERQMLCLARALLRKSRVVVMDEATASIDVKTEQKLQLMIQREFVDATVLTIAHRLATVLESDRILVLSDGRVAEFDTPRELAKVKGGVFRELAKESGCLPQLL